MPGITISLSVTTLAFRGWLLLAPAWPRRSSRLSAGAAWQTHGGYNACRSVICMPEITNSLSVTTLAFRGWLLLASAWPSRSSRLSAGAAWQARV